MKKKIYVDTISEKLSLTKKDVDNVIRCFIEELTTEIVVEGKASITNLGTFKRIVTKPFSYFSPVDGANMKTEGISKVYFTSSKTLLKRLQEGNK